MTMTWVFVLQFWDKNLCHIGFVLIKYGKKQDSTPTGCLHLNLHQKQLRCMPCVGGAVISCFSGVKTLGNPVDLGLVFQDRPQADCGLTHSRREGKEARKLEGVVGGRTDTIHTVLGRREDRTREQGRVIEVLENEL